MATHLVSTKRPSNMFCSIKPLYWMACSNSHIALQLGLQGFLPPCHDNAPSFSHLGEWENNQGTHHWACFSSISNLQVLEQRRQRQTLTPLPPTPRNNILCSWIQGSLLRSSIPTCEALILLPEIHVSISIPLSLPKRLHLIYDFIDVWLDLFDLWFDIELINQPITVSWMQAQRQRPLLLMAQEAA